MVKINAFAEILNAHSVSIDQSTACFVIERQSLSQAAREACLRCELKESNPTDKLERGQCRGLQRELDLGFRRTARRPVHGEEGSLFPLC